MTQEHVVIVGGSSGIGLASAKRLATAGYQLTLAARDPDRLSQAARAIGSEVAAVRLDCTDEAAVGAFFAQLAPFEHLVISAGGKAVDATVDSIDTKTARALFEVKYWGQYFCAKHAARTIKADGSITMFSAWLSRKPAAGFPTYAAIDGAIESLARVLMLERAPLRVNVVAPGVIDTPLFDTLDDKTRHSTFAAVAERLPLKRVGQPDDVARAVEYLISNPYSNGAVIDVDGGWA
jgi:NAD(P)-dependent dehydrogenase (short-subunit alcohol dehydrogenase family)